MGELTLLSSAFSNGEEIPRKYGYKSDNVNLPLMISGVPQGSQSLVLIMDDPDAQAAVGKVWVHWILWNIGPDVTEIAESSTPSGSLEGKTDFGEIGYGGPAPPDKRHTYVFKLYALDTKLDLPQGSSKTQIEEAIKGHILDDTVLNGTYAP
jgi:Raf kinase inhibitor-like YbhB/YbcL family protein